MTEGSISAVDRDPFLLDRIVTGDEKWCFLDDPHYERVPATWKQRNLHVVTGFTGLSPNNPLRESLGQQSRYFTAIPLKKKP
ncbi:hypothetical protein TNCV_765551 [Trichonephila clavipes]|nr:hypothetical protein TNCV_765551 [Trichonephila clavipes]